MILILSRQYYKGYTHNYLNNYECTLYNVSDKMNCNQRANQEMNLKFHLFKFAGINI